MRHACLIAFLGFIPSLAAAQPPVAADPVPRLGLGFATTNSDATINGEVDAKFDCPGVVLEVPFSATVKGAIDAEQAIARARPILVEKFAPYRDFCRSALPQMSEDGGGGVTLARPTLHVTGGFQGETGASGAVSAHASCPAMSTDIRASFSAARTKQDALDQAKPAMEQQVHALMRYCR
jgi:hypothetical protein